MAKFRTQITPSTAKTSDTSWEKVSQWYGKSVGESGHYYHQHVVIPKSLQLLKLTPDSSVLDLACGQGVLSRHIPTSIQYWGVDASLSLIKQAQQQNKQPHFHFEVGDITQKLPLTKNDFSHAAIILALQNIAHPQKALFQASNHLKVGGQLLLVLNHPFFRIPRQSSWEIDKQNKLQYRRVNRYLSPLKIPIDAHPSQKDRQVTWSFHHPLSSYFSMLHKAGFKVITLEEWTSPKTSQGSAAAMENRSREEFPLFIAILAEKS